MALEFTCCSLQGVTKGFAIVLMSSKKEALQRVILGFAPLADCHTPNLQTFLRRFARQNSVWKHWISQNRLELSRIVESSSLHKFNAYLEACESSLVSHLSLCLFLLIWFAVLVLPRWGRALIVEREEGIQANAQLVAGQELKSGCSRLLLNC